MRGRRSLRIGLAGVGLAIVAAGVLLALLVPRGAGHPPALAGTAIAGRPAAPGFVLTDQAGRSIALAGLRGGPVLVTFLYVHCPDVCPLIATSLDSALRQLGAPARVLAVSVDPRGDTPASVRAFVRERGLGPRFHYLTGSAQALRRVWDAYYVGVQRGPAGPLHSSTTVLVDGAGRQRVRYGADVTAAQVVHDVRALKL